MLKVHIHLSMLLALIMVAGLLPQQASAIPAFARKNNITCSTCHSAWPMLNNTGRRYKERGYRFSADEVPHITITDNLKWDESLPVSVLLAARPYDKKDSGERQIRAIHEVELMVAGPMGESWSGFFEIEAEDEEGFEAGIPAATLSYHHSKAVNLQFSYADILWFDSYNTYSHARRLTRGTQAVISNSFGGADNDGALGVSRQNVALYGRPMDSLFYGLAISGLADDPEGTDGQTLTARLAYEFMPGMMLGALLVDGTCTPESGAANCVVERDFERSGYDMQLNISQLVVTAAYLNAEDDDLAGTNTLEHKACFIQLAYVIETEGRAGWVPLVRYDDYEKNDGAEDITELTFTLSHYFTENIQAYIEYWDRAGDGTTVDDNRLTFQIMAAF